MTRNAKAFTLITTLLLLSQLKIRPSILSLKRMKLTTTIIVGTKPLNVTPLYDNPPDYWSCCREYSTPLIDLKQSEKQISILVLHLIFHRVTVVLELEEGESPEYSHAVFCHDKWRSF